MPDGQTFLAGTSRSRMPWLSTPPSAGTLGSHCSDRCAHVLESHLRAWASGCVYHNDTYIFFFFFFFGRNPSPFPSLSLSLSLSVFLALALALLSAFLILLLSFFADSVRWRLGERPGSAITRGSRGDTKAAKVTMIDGDLIRRLRLLFGRQSVRGTLILPVGRATPAARGNGRGVFLSPSSAHGCGTKP